MNDGATTSTISGKTLAVTGTVEKAFAGDGNGTLIGNAVSSGLLGGRGNDSLSGGVSYDLLDSGAGNDVLIGSTGTDYREGERTGDDVLVMDGDVGTVNADAFNYYGTRVGGAGADVFKVLATGGGLGVLLPRAHSSRLPT